LAVVGIVNSVISVYYYYAIIRQMFFREAEEEASFAVGGGLRAVVGVTAVVVLAIALYAEPFIQLASRSVRLLAAAF
jgi:NADH:ubiquinone oxidoreductase subunit 2 (subunit N)